MDVRHHQIEPGDTLSAVANRFDVTVPALIGANPWIDDPDLILAGWVLHIPATIATPDPPPGPSFKIGAFRNTGPTGGGYPNVATWDPNQPGVAYIGADIGGISKSIDYGKTFTPARRGVGWDDSQHKIAVLKAHNIDGATTVVAGTGFKGGNGEVYASTNNGATWSVDSTDVSFSGQNSNSPLPTGRPRSTDPNLILRVANGVWVAGTYDDGIWISRDNRHTWTNLRLFTGAVHVRSMCHDPGNPSTILVGLWGDAATIPNKGLWRITRLDANPVASQIPNMPTVIESLTVSSNRVFAACGRFGVRKLVGDTVTNITGPISETASAIDAIADLVVVGTAGAAGRIYVSRNSGVNWSHATGSGVDPTVWGSTEVPLALADHKAWQLGGKGCDVSTVAISPDDPDRWIITATSAVWATDDGGRTFRPSAGYQISSYRVSAVNDQGWIVTGSTDHDVIASTDHGNTWQSIGVSGATVTHALALSPDGLELAYSINERDDNQSTAKLWITSDIPGADSGTDSGWSATSAGRSGKRVIGLAWIKLANGGQRLVAAVDAGGVWTKDRVGGSWKGWVEQSVPFMGSQMNRNLHCGVVSNGSNTVIIADRESGVWRSDDYAATWVKVNNLKDAHIAYDAATDRLFVDQHPIVWGAGRLWMYERPANANQPDASFRYDDGTTVTVVDDPMVLATAAEVSSITVNAGTIVMTTGGQGLLIGSYSGEAL